jgi:hypothetical protein
MENHLGKLYNHKTYGFVLAKELETLMLWRSYLKGANGEALLGYRPALAGSWVYSFMAGY